MTKHVVGQEAIPGLEHAADESAVRPELKNRAALSRMLRPEIWGVRVEQYGQITSGMLDAAEPDVLVRDLIDVPRSGRTAVAFPHAESRRDVAVALTPAEYTMIPRNVSALGRASLNRTLAVRPDISQSWGAANRSVAHTLENKTQKISDYLQNALVPQERLLKKFQTAAEHPNLSLFGPEVKMRMALASYRTILDEAIKAMGAQRGWEEDDVARRELVRKASEWRVLYTGRDRIENFGKLTDTLLAYNGAKQAVFKSRLYEMRRVLNRSA